MRAAGFVRAPFPGCRPRVAAGAFPGQRHPECEAALVAATATRTPVGPPPGRATEPSGTLQGLQTAAALGAHTECCRKRGLG